MKALRELPLDKLKKASLVKVKMEDTNFWSDLDTSHDVIGKNVVNQILLLNL